MRENYDFDELCTRPVEDDSRSLILILLKNSDIIYTETYYLNVVDPKSLRTKRRLEEENRNIYVAECGPLLVSGGDDCKLSLRSIANAYQLIKIVKLG